jgi:hypothetical protein
MTAFADFLDGIHSQLLRFGISAVLPTVITSVILSGCGESPTVLSARLDKSVEVAVAGAKQQANPWDAYRKLSADANQAFTESGCKVESTAPIGFPLDSYNCGEVKFWGEGTSTKLDGRSPLDTVRKELAHYMEESLRQGNPRAIEAIASQQESLEGYYYPNLCYLTEFGKPPYPWLAYD